MITLGGVTLPAVLIQGEFSRTSVMSRVASSLGGRPLIWEQEALSSNLDLVGGSDFAWVQRETLLQLYELAKVPESIYSLDYNGTLYQVRFRNEDPPVIEATPIVGRPNQQESDYYKDLVIKLMEL